MKESNTNLNKGTMLNPHPKRSFMFRLTCFLFFLCFAALVIIGYDAYTFLSTPAEEPGQHIVFTVEAGSTFDQVALNLQKAGAITDLKRFKLLAKYKKSLGAIKAGDFLIDTNWTPDKVLHHLTKGSVLLSTLTFREGLTWWQVARAIDRQGFAKYSDFVEVIHDPEFLKAHAIPFDTAEGFLFPDTYHLTKPKSLDKEQAKKIASMLVKTFWRKNIAVWKRLPQRSTPLPEGYGKDVAEIGSGVESIPPLLPILSHSPSPAENKNTLEETSKRDHQDINIKSGTNSTEEEAIRAQTKQKEVQLSGYVYAKDPSLEEGFVSPDNPSEIAPEPLKKVIILASIVERETAVPEERARVAGVYYNRITLNMLLQCDPTVIYGIGPSFVGPIRRSQLQDSKNVYNTYKRPGLPPGPIGSMGVFALQGALIPEAHNYIFFVATGKGKGHTFSKTLKEHNRAVLHYRMEISR